MNASFKKKSSKLVENNPGKSVKKFQASLSMAEWPPRLPSTTCLHTQQMYIMSIVDCYLLSVEVAEYSNSPHKEPIALRGSNETSSEMNHHARSRPCSFGMEEK